MTEKRFTSLKNNERIVGFIDNVTKTHHSFDLEVIWKLNHMWEQTQRFEKHNQYLEKENEQLKSELQGMEELLKSYRKTIKHDAELLADATKNGYLPPLEDWKGDVE